MRALKPINGPTSDTGSLAADPWDTDFQAGILTDFPGGGPEGHARSGGPDGTVPANPNSAATPNANALSALAFGGEASEGLRIYNQAGSTTTTGTTSTLSTTVTSRRSSTPSP